jgi:1-deoxy-D-xylulose-5-phosphate synthase
MLHEVFGKFKKVITVEDGTVVGGFGSAILEFMNANAYKADVKIVGIPDAIVEHGSLKELYNEVGIDANHIADIIREMVKDKVTVNQL